MSRCFTKILLYCCYWLNRISSSMRLVYASTSASWLCAWVTTSCTCVAESLTPLKCNRWRPRLKRRNLLRRTRGKFSLPFFCLPAKWMLLIREHSYNDVNADGWLQAAVAEGATGSRGCREAEQGAAGEAPKIWGGVAEGQTRYLLTYFLPGTVDKTNKHLW